MAPLPIAVVDSSLSFRVNLQSALMAAGFPVMAYESSVSARASLKKNSFSMMIIEDVISDSDGGSILREVGATALAGKIPIIMTSTDTGVAGRLRGLAMGATDVIGKSSKLVFLVKRVRHLLDMPASTAGGFGTPNPARILLADDSTTFLNTFAERLLADGHDVVLAKSGTEVISLLDAQAVDAIVLDLFMPGISAHETCRRIRSSLNGAGTPVMLLTGRDDASVLATGASAGVDDCMVKSSDLNAMALRVGELLRVRPRRRSDSRSSFTVPDSVRMAVGKSPLAPSAPASYPGDPPISSRTRLEMAVVEGEREVLQSTPPPPPSSSGVRHSDMREAPPSGRFDSPLFEEVLLVSGLQHVIGRGSLRRAMERAGVDPRSLTVEGLEKAMPEIRQTLGVFLQKDDAERCFLAIAALRQKAS